MPSPSLQISLITISSLFLDALDIHGRTMTPPPPEIPSTYYDLRAYYRTHYEADFASGKYLRFVIPLGALQWIVLILYYLVPHDRFPALRSLPARLSLWVALSAHCLFLILRTRSDQIFVFHGLFEAFFVAWSGALLLCSDVQRDFKRVRRVDVRSQCAERSTDERRREFVYKWEGYPQGNFSNRLGWVMDLICNLRGVAWNWKPYGILPRPPFVQDQLDADATGTEIPPHVPSSSEIDLYLAEGHSKSFRHNAVDFLVSFLWVDLLRTLMIHDPYFWGYPSAPLPAYVQRIFPAFLLSFSRLNTFIRVALALHYIYRSVRLLYNLSTCIFLGLSFIPAFHSVLNVNGEYWLHPSTNLPFRHALEMGLVGFWGMHWHQYLRATPTLCGRKILECLGIVERSTIGKLLLAFIVFGMNGALHSVSGHSAIGDSDLRRGGVMAFFVMQPVGIILEQCVWWATWKTGLRKYISPRLRHVANAAWFAIWLTVVGGPTIGQDYARCAYVILEPLPVTPLRLLGFGVKGDPWWLYDGLGVYWHSGKSIWSSGLAV
ncbi:hypothetical protein P152DRAFT_462539 [Eremomyces bilateralis CBS 781.70]|uniref:Wax synthase domain-containing protein n=1 Tax=Eremomyces bilateralis CBS 781.70 TaxID=1392243 RepID=A0A6G1FRJ6_9PEZI|nr:uncharacterized protein P152DRAFT_462539 [Eremomyces bilateralis CBS 781.70]KAF1808407.1 hypothetical protein P152DRAFT_462539 [Eremomyces bilateralis CBS 781.70]